MNGNYFLLRKSWPSSANDFCFNSVSETVIVTKFMTKLILLCVGTKTDLPEWMTNPSEIFTILKTYFKTFSTKIFAQCNEIIKTNC